MKLNHIIKNTMGSECFLMFNNISTVTFNEADDYDDNDNEVVYDVKILLHNSRRTQIFCYKNEYDRFIKAYSDYAKWLAENPALEMSKFELSMMNELIKESIQNSLKGVSEVGETIKNGLIELNETMSKKVIENQSAFLSDSSSKIEQINETLKLLNQTVESVSKSAALIQQFVPEEIDTQIKINELNKNSIDRELKE